MAKHRDSSLGRQEVEISAFGDGTCRSKFNTFRVEARGGTALCVNLFDRLIGNFNISGNVVSKNCLQAALPCLLHVLSNRFVWRNKTDFNYSFDNLRGAREMANENAI